MSESIDYSDFQLSDLANALAEAKEVLEKCKQAQSAAQKHFDDLRLHVIPERMEEMGLNSVTIKGLGRLGLSADLYAGIESGKQLEAYRWLRDNGFGDLVKDYVHSSTMKAFLKEQIKEGTELPEGLFKVSPFMRASLTKK